MLSYFNVIAAAKIALESEGERTEVTAELLLFDILLSYNLHACKKRSDPTQCFCAVVMLIHVDLSSFEFVTPKSTDY